MRLSPPRHPYPEGEQLYLPLRVPVNQVIKKKSDKLPPVGFSPVVPG